MVSKLRGDVCAHCLSLDVPFLGPVLRARERTLGPVCSPVWYQTLSLATLHPGQDGSVPEAMQAPSFLVMRLPQVARILPCLSRFRIKTPPGPVLV